MFKNLSGLKNFGIKAFYIRRTTVKDEKLELLQNEVQLKLFVKIDVEVVKFQAGVLQLLVKDLQNARSEQIPKHTVS